MRLLFAVTMCFVIGGVLFVAGCSEPDSGGFDAKESKPKESKPPSEKTATEEAFQAPASPVVGEAMDAEDFEFRVLDVTTDTSWFYPETEEGFGSQAESMAGQFIVVWYSARNTGPGPLTLYPGAKIEVDSGETFGQAQGAECDELGKLQPRELGLSCFIFDVPADVEEESVWVQFRRGNLAPETFDLTRAQPGAGPDEVLALQYEYFNVGYFDLAYSLFSEESKELFTAAQYEETMSVDYKRYPASDYAFPSVQIEGDHATVERIITFYDNKNIETSQDRATQEFVKEDGTWRSVARPEQVSYFTR